MPLRDFSEDFFQTTSAFVRLESKSYKSIYDEVVVSRNVNEINEINQILSNVATKASSTKTIKDPEYFFKFLALIQGSNRTQILTSLNYGMFDNEQLIQNQSWVASVTNSNEDIGQKLSDIFKNHNISLTHSLDLAAKLEPVIQSFPLDFASSALQAVSTTGGAQQTAPVGITYIKSVTDGAVAKNGSKSYIQPKGEGTKLIRVTLENLGNHTLEDHLYFDSDGNQFPKDEVPGKAVVDSVKALSSSYHTSGALKNSFLQEEPRRIIVDSMKQSGANTCAFVCASDNPKKQNQKVVDCVTFGEPSIRLRLEIKYGDGTPGVLYYYPYERKLTEFLRDDKEQEVGPELFPNIVISDPVRCKSFTQGFSIDDAVTQTSSAKGKSTKVTFDGGVKKEFVGPHTFALDLSAKSDTSLDLGNMSQ